MSACAWLSSQWAYFCRPSPENVPVYYAPSFNLPDNLERILKIDAAIGTEKEQNPYVNAFTAAAFQRHLKVLTLLINTQVQVIRDDLDLMLWRQRKDDLAALDVILQARPNMSIDDDLIKVPFMQDHPEVLDTLLSKAIHRPTSSCLSSWMLE